MKWIREQNEYNNNNKNLNEPTYNTQKFKETQIISLEEKKMNINQLMMKWIELKIFIWLVII